MRLDMQASLLNQISATQIHGDVRVELDLEQLLGLDIDVKTTVKADDYDQLYLNSIQIMSYLTQLNWRCRRFHSPVFNCTEEIQAHGLSMTVCLIALDFQTAVNSQC